MPSLAPMPIMGDAVALPETGMPDTVAAAMETGENNASSVRVQDEEREESSRVVIAATEAYVEETRNIARSRARYYRCVVKTCNAMLLGLVVGFAGIFVYAWIDASRKSHYDYTIALITVMFVGTVICALGYRRRLATAMGHLEDENSGLPMQMQVDQIDFFEQWTQPPKGVPQHVRQNFDYFIFSTPADTVPARKLPPSPASDPCGLAAKLVCQGSTTGSDAQASAASGFSVAESNSKGAMTTPSKRGSATNSFEEDKADSVAGSAVAVPQYQMPLQQQQHLQHGLFSWTAPALTDCSVCLEAYRAGDRICRLPCMHAFHAVCIDTWLDQHHVCPHCRLDLLPPESSWDRSSRSSAMNAAPFSNLFGSLDHIMTVPRPPTISGSRTTDASPAAATAAAPIAPFAHSPAYGVSPASAYGGVVHFRRSPRVPRPEPSRHGTHSSTSGSPAAVARVQPSHFMSPAYTPSPLSTANSSNLRWSPQFVTMGTRSRGTPVPPGVSLGVFPPLVPHSSSFTGLDAPQQRSGSNGGGGARSGSRRFLPPTPSRGRGQTTHQSPSIAPQNPSPSQQQQQSPHRGHHLDGGSQSHEAMPEVRAIGDGQGQGQSQGQPVMGAREGVSAPSPPPLPRLTPRSQSQALSRGEMPANPPPAGSPRVFHGAAFDEVAGGRGATDGNVRGRSGSVGINGWGGVTRGGGRNRSGSGHKHLRMLNLNRRPRSSSCDVVIGSSGSPGLFDLGNVSPKVGRGIGGEFDHLGGTVVTNKGRITRRPATRPMLRLASSEDAEDIRGTRSSGFTMPFRRRQRSDDSAVGGDLLGRRDALERAFMSGSSDSSDRQGSPTEGRRSIAGSAVPDSSAQGQEDGDVEEDEGLQQQAEREQQQAHQPEGQPQEPLRHHQRLQEQQQQEEDLVHQGAAPHAYLSFDDDDTSGESEGGVMTGGEGDEDNLDDEEFEDDELQVEVTIGRLEGHGNFWNMFACQ